MAWLHFFLVTSYFSTIVNTNILKLSNRHFISSIFQPLGINTNKSDVNSTLVNVTINLHSTISTNTVKPTNSSLLLSNPDTASSSQLESKPVTISIDNQYLSKNDTITLVHQLELPNNNITAVILHICNGISTIYMSTIIKTCLKNTSTLTSLSLSHCGLNKESFYKVRSNKMFLSNAITSLDLSFNPLHAHVEKKKDLVSSFFSLDSLNSLTATVTETLTSVSSNNNNNGNTKLLTSSSSSSLSSTSPSSSSLLLPSSSYPIIASIIKRLNSLQSLSLNGNSLKNLEDFNNIIYSLRRHPSITDVSLSACDINDEHMESLGFGLKSNYNISRINLSMNKITSKGIFALASIFKSSTSSTMSKTTSKSVASATTKHINTAAVGRNIKYLDLSYNPVGSDGLMMITDLIQSNKLPALEYLLIRQISANPESIHALLTALSSRNESSKLIYLDISGNEMFSSVDDTDNHHSSSSGHKKKNSKSHHKNKGSGSGSGGAKSLKQMKQVLHSQWNEWTTQAQAYTLSSSNVMNNWQESMSKSMNGLLQQFGSDTDEDNNKDNEKDDYDYDIRQRKRKQQIKGLPSTNTIIKSSIKNKYKSPIKKKKAKTVVIRKNDKVADSIDSQPAVSKKVVTLSKSAVDAGSVYDDRDIPLSKSLSQQQQKPPLPQQQQSLLSKLAKEKPSTSVSISSTSSQESLSKLQKLQHDSKATISKKEREVLREQLLKGIDSNDENEVKKSKQTNNNKNFNSSNSNIDMRGGEHKQKQKTTTINSRKSTIIKNTGSATKNKINSNKSKTKSHIKNSHRKSINKKLLLKSPPSLTPVVMTLSVEEIERREAIKMNEKVLTSLFQFFTQCRHLRYIGLAKVGMSDGIVTQAATVANTFLANSNTNSKKKQQVITSVVKLQLNTSAIANITISNTTTSDATSLTSVLPSQRVRLIPGRILPSLNKLPYSTTTSAPDDVDNTLTSVMICANSSSSNQVSRLLETNTRVVDVVLCLNSDMSTHHQTIQNNTTISTTLPSKNANSSPSIAPAAAVVSSSFDKMIDILNTIVSSL